MIRLPMNLPRAPEMYPNELPEPGGVIVFESLSISKSLEDGVAADQGHVEAGLGGALRVGVGEGVVHPADRREVGDH